MSYVHSVETATNSADPADVTALDDANVVDREVSRETRGGGGGGGGERERAYMKSIVRRSTEPALPIKAIAVAGGTSPAEASTLEIGRSSATAPSPKDVASENGTANHTSPPSRYPLCVDDGLAAIALIQYPYPRKQTTLEFIDDGLGLGSGFSYIVDEDGAEVADDVDDAEYEASRAEHGGIGAGVVAAYGTADLSRM